MTCPACGSAAITEVKSWLEAGYEETASHCSNCDNEFVSPVQMKANKAAARAATQRTMTVTTPTPEPTVRSNQIFPGVKESGNGS